MSTQHSEDDAFTAYLFNKLLPFLAKYWMFLLITAGVLIGTICVIGFYSMHSQGEEQEILNNIYGSLKKKKDISTATLENLNEQYGDHGASLEVKWRLAGKYADDKNYKAAANVYKEILSQHPDRSVAVQARLGLGSCLEQGENYDAALQTYSEGAEHYEDHPRVSAYFHFRKASAYYYKTEYLLAEEALAKALEVLEKAPEQESQKRFDTQFKENLDFLSRMIKVNKK